jgi:hypothetical protein
MIGIGIGTRNRVYRGQETGPGLVLVEGYKNRVTADGGYFEGISCLLNKLNNL